MNKVISDAFQARLFLNIFIIIELYESIIFTVNDVVSLPLGTFHPSVLWCSVHAAVCLPKSFLSGKAASGEADLRKEGLEGEQGCLVFMRCCLTREGGREGKGARV